VTETPAIAPTPTAGRVLDELEEHGEEIVEEAAARLDGRFTPPSPGGRHTGPSSTAPSRATSTSS